MQHRLASLPAAETFPFRSLLDNIFLLVLLRRLADRNICLELLFILFTFYQTLTFSAPQTSLQFLMSLLSEIRKLLLQHKKKVI